MPPGDGIEVAVTVESTEMAPGFYECDFIITNTDPLTPELVVPISLNVLPNELPIARDDVAFAPPFAPIEIDVLANDSDGNGDILRIISVEDPVRGTAEINDGKTIIFEFLARVNRQTFDYTICDGNGGEATAKITVFEDLTDIDNWSNEPIPTNYELQQNFPNPFNPTTQIRFGLPQAARVKIEIYTLMGRRVAVALDAYRPAGYHELSYDASGLGSGVYFYRIQTAGFHAVKKMVLMQ